MITILHFKIVGKIKVTLTGWKNDTKCKFIGHVYKFGGDIIKVIHDHVTFAELSSYDHEILKELLCNSPFLGSARPLLSYSNGRLCH